MEASLCLGSRRRCLVYGAVIGLESTYNSVCKLANDVSAFNPSEARVSLDQPCHHRPTGKPLSEYSYSHIGPALPMVADVPNAPNAHPKGSLH